MHKNLRIAILIGLAVGLLLIVRFGLAPVAPDLPRLTLLETIEREDFARAQETLQAARDAIGAHGAGDRALMRALQAFTSTDPALRGKLERWVEQAPDSAMARLALGVHLRHLGRSHRGMRTARHTNRVQFAHFHGYAALAADQYRKVVALDPENSLAHAFLANLPSAVADPAFGFEQALHGPARLSETAWYQALLKAQPKWGGSLAQIRAMLDVLEQRIPENPLLAELRGYDLYVEADQLSMRDRDSEALAVVDRALAKGSHVDFLILKAQLQRALERHDDALRTLDAALEKAPEDYFAMEERADALAELERHDEAIETLDRILRYDPLDPGALYRKASQLRQLGRMAEAIETIDKALTFGAQQGRIQEIKSRIHFEMGDYAASRDAAIESVKADPASSGGQLRLVMAYNELLDCKNILASASRYVFMCEVNDDCSPANVGWAKNIEQVVASHPACQAQLNQSPSPTGT